MNSRLKDFENLITRPDGSVDDLFSERQRETNELEQIMSMNPQQAYQLSTSIQAQFDSLKLLIEPMRDKFVKACAEAIKDKPDPARQQPYQNVLPYGMQEGDANPSRGNVKPDINASLENLDPSLTNQLHQLYIRVFRKMFPDSYKELKDEIFENYGNKSVRANDIDEVCLNQILSSAVGSMFDWPSIDPKSVGLGSIEHIADLFQKYYMGEVDEKNPHQEKETKGRKYTGAGNSLEIQGDEFYNDFINGFFFRHCVEGFVSKYKTGPSDFKKDIEGFYDFNPDLWFENKDTTGTKFKYSDATKDFDSYGHFFKVKQPVKWEHAEQVQTVGPARDPRNKNEYTGNGGTVSWDAAVQAAEAKKNALTGFYNTYADDARANQTFIVTNEDKELCCLFHKAAIKDRTFEPAAGAVANRVFTPNPTVRPLKPFFETANPANGTYGEGTDYGINNQVNNDLQGANASINIVAQLLYNSESIGFHLTHNEHNGNAPSRTRLVVGGIDGIQTINAYTCGVRTGGAHYVDNGAGGNVYDISDGGGAPQGPGRSPLIYTANAAIVIMPNTEIGESFSKNSFQVIELKTLLKGGKPKHIKSLKAKSGIKKTLKIKHKKHKQNKQKGGAAGHVPVVGTAVLFDIRSADPTVPINTSPSLDASRLDFKITKKIFENYRKAIKEYVKRFRNNDPTAKIQTSILDKLLNINHLGIFYHGPTDILNFGGNIGNNEPDDNIEFKELGEIFLFCSVISNTIKLMIHFFKNIKSCINHFIKVELEVIKTQINKSLKTVNNTLISSFNSSYFEKYTDGCNKLIDNINKLVEFLENNTMRLGKPIGHGAIPNECLTDNQQIAMNLFFGANISHQSANRGATPTNPTPNTTYPIEYYTFHHYLIDFFSINSTQHFSKINTMRFERTLRVLSSGNIVLNNGFVVQSTPAPHVAYPKKEYSITNVSLGGIPLTFIKTRATQFSWMTYGFLLNFREKSNEQLEKDKLLEINQSLSQISSKDKLEIKQKVTDAYKRIRPLLADPKIDLSSKNKVLLQIFMAFFEDSNKVAKMIIQDHDEMEKKRKSVNIRKKTTITNIVQKRSITAAESSRILEPKEIEIQQEMRKYSYKVDCLVNLLHNILISGHHGSMKNYNIFMYSISRLRNFVYRLYYLNRSFYIGNENERKKLLTESGFDLSKNKTQNNKKTDELFKKMLDVQLVDQNSHTQEWWKVMETTFRSRTAVIHGKYFKLFAFVLMDNEAFLLDIFSMATSTHSVKSYSEILNKDVKTYKDHHGHDIYSPDNMLIKLVPDFTKDTFYKKLLNGKLYYEYTKDGTKNKKKLLEPLFIQGSTEDQLNHIVHDNRFIPSKSGRPAQFIKSSKLETSLQLYRIQKHFVLHASAFRSWAYNLLFSMPTRIDVDDSYFKLHIQTSLNTIPQLAKTQVDASFAQISRINSDTPVVNFKSKVKVNNNSSHMLLNNNINNKRIESQAKYISREQIISLGLVFGDTLN